MSAAVTPPFAVAAIVLCVAAVAKLRAPAAAVTALRAAGWPAHRALVWAAAIGELALGGWCEALPSRAGAGLMAAAYAGFALLGMVLARRHAACGCFGDSRAQSTPAQAAISATLALVAMAATVRVPHGASWILGRGVPGALVLAIAIAAASWGTVLAYTEMPSAWGAWADG